MHANVERPISLQFYWPISASDHLDDDDDDLRQPWTTRMICTRDSHPFDLLQKNLTND